MTSAQLSADLTPWFCWYIYVFYKNVKDPIWGNVFFCTIQCVKADKKRMRRPTGCRRSWETLAKRAELIMTYEMNKSLFTVHTPVLNKLTYSNIKKTTAPLEWGCVQRNDCSPVAPTGQTYSISCSRASATAHWQQWINELFCFAKGPFCLWRCWNLPSSL